MIRPSVQPVHHPQEPGATLAAPDRTGGFANDMTLACCGADTGKGAGLGSIFHGPDKPWSCPPVSLPVKR